MNLEQMTEYATTVVSEVILKKNITPPPNDMDISIFMKFCEFHKIENIIFLAIAEYLPGDIKANYQRKYFFAASLQERQNYYVGMIEERFSKEGIDYLLLKGKTISELYPSTDMRISSDIDFYIGTENAEKAKEIMLDIGFSIDVYNDEDDDHDTYIMNKSIYCELHRILIQNNHPWKAECNKIPQRLEKNAENEHQSEMSLEDFYLYNLAHTAKHMKFSGIGIRAFLDMWIIESTYGDKLDRAVLRERLEKANLLEFDQNCRKLCDYWFCGGEADDKILAMSDFAARSGWVGTYEQAAATVAADNAGKSDSKLVASIKMCFGIVFAPYDDMVKRYPILKKHKWLLPFCGLHRGIRAVLFRRDLVKDVTRDINNGDLEKGKAIVKLKKEIGL